jgi:AcrR family transcriptional regulator
LSERSLIFINWRLKIKKEQIIQQIAKLFFEKGYERTSIRDISKALGITNPGLYYYFKSKQEMLFSIIDDLIERALVDMREKIHLIQNPEDKISWIIQSHIKFYAEHRAQTKVLVHERSSLEGEYAKILMEKETEYVNFFKEVVKEILGNSAVEIDIHVATYCLLGMLNWVIHWYNPEGKVPPDTFAENISRIFLRGLRG